MKVSPELFPVLRFTELSELVEDDEKIMEMVKKIHGWNTFTQQRDSLSNACVQLARE